MAKIVIDAREINTTTGRYIYRLVQYLQKIDNENQYLILLDPKDIDTCQLLAKNFSKVSCPYKKFTFGEQLGLNKQLKALKPDLVHFTMPHQPILYRGKVVTTVHDLTGIRFKNPSANPLVIAVKQQVFKFVLWYVPKKSTLVITPSEYTKKDVVGFSHINPDKVIVTYEAAEEFLDPIDPIKSLQSKEFIMYLGRPQPHKNLSRLIEAFAMLKKDHPNLLLILAGRRDAVYDSYIKVAKKLGVEDSVTYTDYIPDGQLKWLYRACKAYIFPSLGEGFGLPGLEAMAHGAPVVCSTATSLPEVYGNGAWYFNPEDVRDMAKSINEVLINTDLRNKLIRAGREQSAKYSWQRMAEQTLNVYKKALEK
jgi:glycosyltransferase involved in cell wall biosynthesis